MLVLIARGTLVNRRPARLRLSNISIKTRIKVGHCCIRFEEVGEKIDDFGPDHHINGELDIESHKIGIPTCIKNVRGGALGSCVTSHVGAPTIMRFEIREIIFIAVARTLTFVHSAGDKYRVTKNRRTMDSLPCTGGM